jgi:hypothetical protein
MITEDYEVDTDLERTPPQVHTSIAYDGELTRPSVGTLTYQKIRQIRIDPTVKMVRQFAVAPIVAGKWVIEAEDDAPEGAKEFIEKEITRHRLDLITQGMYGQIDYGWIAFERVIEDLPTGEWGIKWLKPLLHDITTILVDAGTGAYIGVRQQPNSIVSSPTQLAAQIDLTGEETVLINAEVEGTNWYGEPVMKALEAIYDEQKVINTGARKYDQRIAGSHWIIYYPIGTSKYKGSTIDNGALAQELIRGIESMGGIALPRSAVEAFDQVTSQMSQQEASQWKLELLSDKGSGQTPFLERYKYLDILKVRAFGYPERAMLEGQFGTKAEAEAHADLAILNLEMKHAQLVQQVNRQLCDWYLRVNWGPDYCGKVFIKPAPLADRAIAFFRQVYLALVANRDGFYQEAAAVDWQAFRDSLGIKEAPPIVDQMVQYDEYGNPIPPSVDSVDPITGLPVTDPNTAPFTDPTAPAFARDIDGKFGDGGKPFESPKDLEHSLKMQKLRQELEGTKQSITVNGRERKLIVKEIRTSREAGRRKVDYSHVGEAFDLDGNHVVSVVRYPAGNWRVG